MTWAKDKCLIHCAQESYNSFISNILQQKLICVDQNWGKTNLEKEWVQWQDGVLAQARKHP